MTKLKSLKATGLLLLLTVYLVPLGSAWLDSWGKMTTGGVKIENPLLVAKPGNQLELNDREVDNAEKVSINGQELIHFDSKELPGKRLDRSKIKMDIRASTVENYSQILELRLRYTNQTGTFIACNQEILVGSEPRSYTSSCNADIKSDDPVRYHYEIIGAPKTDYSVIIDGSTYVEVDVKQ